jgi:hypothetical protein
MRTARALNPNAAVAAEDFPVQVRDLQAWTSATAAMPASRRILGGRTRPRSGSWAAPTTARSSPPTSACRTPSPTSSPTARAPSRRSRSTGGLYQPSERHPEPQATLCIWALVAASDEEARHLSLSRDRWRIDRGRGVLGPLQSPDEIARRGFDAAEEQGLASMRARAFVGSAQTVSEGIRRLAATFELDEVVINTWAHDPAVRRTSYALLAEAFSLSAAPSRT